MKANPTGLILWVLGASGAFLLYCAVKGYTPQSVLAAFINRTTAPVPFTHTGTPTPATLAGVTGTASSGFAGTSGTATGAVA